MVSIHRRPTWALAEHLATPEAAFINRRALLAGLGAGAAALAAPPFVRAARAADDPTAGFYPAPRNAAFTVERPLTPEETSSQYNNFYEFGSHKQIANAAQALETRPWDIEIAGLVDKPQKIGIDELIRKMPLEERLYRHRCVEAWSMTVPWTGFALSELVALAEPQSEAKYLRFETFLDPKMASGQRQVWYPWPYVEGVTMNEARNELAFMVTGAYGKPLAKQFGAPLRLALPWKYGFKSIKSIVKITVTAERPVSFWEEIASSEYGFWANVNPQVPHPRWSQAEERVLHTGETVPTVIYNGYGEQVAGLYENMDGEKLFM
ncbi:protein-methionine-sulfoxide reductase catalytic subunit MsrP [Nitratireductor sp. CAU 1489]|uniref:Protein-methionine-sulfoxide reductase catalytic subunit MsrP n=1 Tax=Nitratireductor arenosus TaxID=2682096 RepID=A0A844QGX7_9HYPH|nr:protein-methionine-sulfoxide reductase catalytic subunit MsrP [Nitratireductor arenosus]MVA97019.1 protein-methionine-sulfoxide reductase catalytic subunit MsrP [Nitratireductor arenosus]